MQPNDEKRESKLSKMMIIKRDMNMTLLRQNSSPVPFISSPTSLQNSNISTTLSVMNGKRLSQMQERLDQHEEALQELYHRVKVQDAVIGKLIMACYELKERLGISEQTQRRATALLSMVSFHFQFVKLKAAKSTSLQESFFKLKSTQLWQAKEKLVKVLLMISCCHVGLSVTKVYALQEMITASTVGLVLPRPLASRVKTVGNLMILAASLSLLASGIDKVKNSSVIRFLYFLY